VPMNTLGRVDAVLMHLVFVGVGVG
jgi:hypothetical protein